MSSYFAKGGFLENKGDEFEYKGQDSNEMGTSFSGSDIDCEKLAIQTS